MKQIEISFVAENRIKIVHRVINTAKDPVELSIWGISAMAQAGRAIVPQEPYGEGNDFLLPARSMAIWQFTNMSDPRWVWGSRYIQAIQDPIHVSEQKIGIMNKPGWAAYTLNDNILIKHFTHHPHKAYPDLGSNNEIYICKYFLEIETLGPLTIVLPGTSAEATEYWSLYQGRISEHENEIDQDLLPLVNHNPPHF